MKQKLFLYFIIALLIFILDQSTKTLIKLYVHPFEVIRILPFFNILYVENIGSAFGMFKSLGNAFFIFISTFAIAFVSFLLFKEKDNRLCYSLVLGGAAGNLADRLIYGYVIDFLDFHIAGAHWPVFNIADAALTIGIILLFYKTLFKKS
jgi:signal peptidase II